MIEKMMNGFIQCGLSIAARIILLHHHWHFISSFFALLSAYAGRNFSGAGRHAVALCYANDETAVWLRYALTMWSWNTL
jgi:hypothetical protein